MGGDSVHQGERGESLVTEISPILWEGEREGGREGGEGREGREGKGGREGGGMGGGGEGGEEKVGEREEQGGSKNDERERYRREEKAPFHSQNLELG